MDIGRNCLVEGGKTIYYLTSPIIYDFYWKNLFFLVLWTIYSANKLNSMCIKPSIGRVIFLRKFVYNRLKNYSSIINISLERKATDFYATEYEKAQLSMKVYGINFDSFAV